MNIMVTNIRQAKPSDVVHLIALNEIEYENTEHDEKFSSEVCERWVHTMMLDPDAVMLVICDDMDRPFGYLSGTIDFSSLSSRPTAVTHHWYVHNPANRYGRGNFGLKLLNVFEGWARSKGAINTLVGIKQTAFERRSYDLTFNKLGYKPNTMYYSKRIQ